MLCLVAGVAGCKEKAANKQAPAPASSATPLPAARQAPSIDRPLETPDVRGTGVVPAVNLGPKVTVSKDTISVDGQPVLQITQSGLIDRDRLEILTRQLESKVNSDAPVAVALDATLPYRRVGVVLDALRTAGFRNLALLVGSGSTMIPLELPDAEEANRAGVRPIVTIRQKRVTLWSASGEEGTQMQPKASFVVGEPADFAPLTHALAEIVQRRWPDGRREDADRTIILQLEPNATVQTLLEVSAAVRADGSLSLFPAIFLAGA